MGLIKEFRDFAMRGNVMDMAVGIIIGAAFGKIVSSLVADVVMPPIGKIMGNANFTDYFYPLDGIAYDSLQAARDAGAPVVAYGSFLTTVLDFIIVAFAIFMVIRLMNSATKRFEEEKAAAPPPAPPKEQVLLEEIRDQLVSMNKN